VDNPVCNCPRQPSQAPFPKPWPPDTPEALLSPILRRRSSTSESRAAPGAGALRRGGGAALGAWEEPPAGGAVGGGWRVCSQCWRKRRF